MVAFYIKFAYHRMFFLLLFRINFSRKKRLSALLTATFFNSDLFFVYRGINHNLFQFSGALKWSFHLDQQDTAESLLRYVLQDNAESE